MIKNAWRYEIKYGPEGEENYAWVYDADGEMVCTAKTHHAEAIVSRMNALASLQGEDAVERVARIIDPYAWSDLDDMTPTERFVRESRLPKMQEEACTKARTILATGLVPDEREKCAKVAEAECYATTGRQIAAAIRSGGGE